MIRYIIIVFLSILTVSLAVVLTIYAVWLIRWALASSGYKDEERMGSLIFNIRHGKMCGYALMGRDLSVGEWVFPACHERCYFLIKI